MAQCQITHVRKRNRYTPHENITHVANMSARWILTQEEAIQSIESQTDTFYIQDPDSGKRFLVGVVYPKDGRPPHLQTHMEGQWNNNLHSLEEC